MDNNMNNNEIKNIGFIFTIILLTTVLIISEYKNDKKLEMISEAITIIEEQDNEILELKESIKEKDSNIIKLETRIEDMEKLDIILKDLARSWKKK